MGAWRTSFLVTGSHLRLGVRATGGSSDLDSAAGQINAVVTLAPAFRIATITSYLADLDTLLGQRRFAGNENARGLRGQIATFTVAASPAASADGNGP